MMEDFKEEVRIENEKKKTVAIAEANKKRNSNTLQSECNETITERSKTWTDNQIAKKAGVGTGTANGVKSVQHIRFGWYEYSLGFL